MAHIREFTVDFNDLNLVRQEELANAVAETILTDWYNEALEHKAEYPDQTTWEEIVCRLYDFDYQDWEEQPIGKNHYDWKSIVVQFAEDHAQDKVAEAVGQMTIKVEL